MLFTQKSEGEMSDFEKLIFAESYIKVLKKALREKEKNKEIYDKNLLEITEIFELANPKFKKINSYKKEMKAHREKARKANIISNRAEHKNYHLREKVRKLEGELLIYHENHKGNG